MQRLDKFLFEKNYFISREKARVAASEGRVFVDGKAREPAFKVDGNEKIEVKIEDQSDIWSLLALQGPDTNKVL